MSLAGTACRSCPSASVVSWYITTRCYGTSRQRTGVTKTRLLRPEASWERHRCSALDYTRTEAFREALAVGAGRLHTSQTGETSLQAAVRSSRRSTPAVARRSRRLGESKKHNDGTTFLLNVIGVFSKRALCIPLKRKAGPALVAAFESLQRLYKPTRERSSSTTLSEDVEGARYPTLHHAQRGD